MAGGLFAFGAPCVGRFQRRGPYYSAHPVSSPFRQDSQGPFDKQKRGCRVQHAVAAIARTSVLAETSLAGQTLYWNVERQFCEVARGIQQAPAQFIGWLGEAREACVLACFYRPFGD